jgi:hypothetical protein
MTMPPGWYSEQEADLKAVCAHIWSREMGVRVKGQPYALSICEWCGRVRLRTVDSSKLDATLRTMGRAA